jgi:hypothetical protein
MSFALFCSTWFFLIKTMVLVPVLRPGISWARCLILFPYECCHVALVVWFAMRWQYFKSSPFTPITEFAILHSHFMGSLHCAICFGVTVYVVPVTFGVLV